MSLCRMRGYTPVQQDQLIIGIDIGSQYIKASALSMQDESFMVSAVVETQGVEKGNIVDVKSLGSSIKKAIGKLEVKVSKSIQAAFVCIQPEYVMFKDTTGHAELFGDAVSQREMDIALDSAQRLMVDDQHEIIDILVSRYYVDDTIYANPMGIKGKTFDFTGQIVTAEKSLVDSLYDAMAQAKVGVLGTGLSSLAAASLLLTSGDLQKGTVLVDTGAHNTRAVLFKNQKIVATENVKLGGKNITRDLAIVLKISLLEAEELKKSFAKGTLAKDHEQYDLIQEIIEARIQEMMNFVEDFVDKQEAHGPLRKVVVYGGGLCGFREMNKLYKSTLKLSTNFVTSDIIRDDGVLTIQSSGLAYNLKNALHLKGAIHELIRKGTESVPDAQASGEEDFFKKYELKFGEEKLYREREEEYEDEDEEFEDEGIFQRIRIWFQRIMNKLRK